MWEASIGWLVALCSAAVAWSYKRDAAYELENSKDVRNGIVQTQTALKSSALKIQFVSQEKQCLEAELRQAETHKASLRQERDSALQQLEGKKIQVKRLQNQQAMTTKETFLKERYLNDINDIKKEHKKESKKAAAHTHELQSALTASQAAEAVTKAQLEEVTQKSTSAAAVAKQEQAQQQQKLTLLESQVKHAEQTAKLAVQAQHELVTQHTEQVQKHLATAQHQQQQILEQANQLQQERSACDKAKRDVQQLQAERKTLEASHKSASQEAAAGFGNKEALWSAQLSEQQSKYQMTAQQLRSLQAEQEKTLAVIEDLQTQMGVHKEARLQAEQQVSKLEIDKAQLQQQLAERPQQTELDSMAHAHDELSSQLAALSRQLEETSTQYAAAKEELQEQDALHDQLEMLKQQHHDEAILLQNAHADLEKATLQTEQLTAEHDAACHEVAQLHQLLSAAPTQDALDQQAKEHEQEKAQLLQQGQAELAAHAADHAHWQEQRHALQAAADSKLADAEQAQRLLEDQVTECNALQQQLHQREGEVKAASEKLLQAEDGHAQHVAGLQADLVDVRSQLKRAGLELEQQAQDQIQGSASTAEVQTEHAEANVLVCKLQAELQDVNLDRQDMLAKMARLQAQMKGTEAEAAASAGTCQALQQKLDAALTSQFKGSDGSEVVRLTLNVQQDDCDDKPEQALESIRQQLADKQAAYNQLQRQLFAAQAEVQGLQTAMAEAAAARAGDGPLAPETDSQSFSVQHQMPRQSVSQLQKQKAALELELGKVKSKAELTHIDAQQAFRLRDDAQSTLNKLETNLTAAMADSAAVKTDLAAAMADLTTTKSDLSAAKTDLAAALADATAAKTDLTAVKTDLAAAMADSTAAKTDLAAALADSVAAKTELTIAKSDLSAAKTDLAAALADATAANTDLATATSDLIAAKSDLADAEAYVATLKADWVDIQVNSFTAKAELAVANTDLAASKANLAEVQTDLAAANAEAAVLRHMCQQLQRQANSSLPESTALQAKLKEAECHRDNLSGMLENARADLTAAKTEAHNLQNMCTELQQQVTQHQDTEQALHEAQADRDAMQEQVQALTLKIERVRESAATAATKKVAHEVSLARGTFQKHTQAVTKAKSQAEDALHAAQAQLITAQANASSLETQLASSKDELADATHQLSSKQEQLNKAFAELENAKADINGMRNQLDSALSRQTTDAEGFADFQDQLNSKQEQLDKALAGLEAVRADLKSMQHQLQSAVQGQSNAEEQLTASQRQLSSKQEQLDKAQEDMQNAKAELQRTQDQLGHAQDALSSSQEDCDTSKSQLGSYQEHLRVAEVQLASAQQQLSSTQARLMTNEVELQELQEVVDKQREDIDVLTKDRDAMREEVMQKLDQFGTINKELSEHRSTSKALQQQVDQLKCLTQESSRSDFGYQTSSKDSSPLPKQYGSSSSSSQGPAGTRSPADLSSAFAAAHSSQITSSVQAPAHVYGHSTAGPDNLAEAYADEGQLMNYDANMHSSLVTQPEAGQSLRHDLSARQDGMESALSMQSKGTSQAGTTPNAEATSPQVHADMSSPPSSTSSGSKENRPHAHLPSSGIPTGSPLTVKIRAAALTDNPDHVCVDLRAGEEATGGHDGAQDGDDGFAADTDESLTASLASDSGLSRQGSMSGLSSFPATPTSHMSEVSDGLHMRNPFANHSPSPLSRIPLGIGTPPASPAQLSSAALSQSKRQNSSTSLASTASTPRSVRQGVQSQAGYNLSVASIFHQPSM